MAAPPDATTLKSYFETGDIPTESQFAEHIDASVYGTWQPTTAYLAGDVVWSPSSLSLIQKVADGNSDPVFNPALWEAYKPSTTVTVFVDDYATGDGTTDDTAAIQSAFDQINGTDNTTIIFGRAKTYRLSNAINLDTQTGFSIEGNGSTLKYLDGVTPAGSTYCLNLRECYQFKVNDLTCDSNRTGRPDVLGGPSYALFHCEYFEFNNCVADDCTHDGWYIYATGDITASDANFTRFGIWNNCRALKGRRNCVSVVAGQYLIFNNCIFDGAGGSSPQYGVDCEPNPTDVENGLRWITFNDCDFKNNVQTGLGAPNINRPSNIYANRCRFINNGQYGTNGTDINLYDCEFWGNYNTVKMGDFGQVIRCRFYNIAASSSGAVENPIIDCGTTDADPNQVTLIDACEFKNCTTNNIIGRQSGLGSVIIQNCIVDTIPGWFVRCFGVGGTSNSRWIVKGNTIRTTGDVAVQVQASTRGCQITNNYIEGPKTLVKNYGYNCLVSGNTLVRTNTGIELDGVVTCVQASRDVTVSNNIIRQNTATQSAVYSQTAGILRATGGNIYDNFSKGANNFVAAQPGNMIVTDFYGGSAPDGYGLIMGSGSMYREEGSGKLWMKTSDTGSTGWVELAAV